MSLIVIGVGCASNERGDEERWRIAIKQARLSGSTYKWISF